MIEAKRLWLQPAFYLFALFIIVVHCDAQPLFNKYALVIGVKAYKYVPHLRNSLNDAHDISAILKEKNFQVIELYDPRTKREMRESIVSYFNLIKDQRNASGLVFYSGHGLQVDGINYLIPTDANPEIKADLDDQCVKMDFVMEAIQQAGNSLNIFIIDACRNNPFQSFSRSTEKGLSTVNTPNGSYIVFATKPGSVASDGEGHNGLFTSKLLKYINTPGLNIEQVFKRVAADVKSESNDTQHPWIASDYTGDFFFSGVTKDSTGNESNFSQILKYDTLAAKDGDAAAQNQLGIIYQNGYGVTIDYPKAIKYYHLAADQGNMDGMTNLGFMYESGLGVEKDYKEAVKYYRMAADSSSSTGQVNLGAMYLYGRGVKKDYSEAFKYFKLSAEQGNEYGQNELGLMYQNGFGTKKDDSEAFKYFRNASGHGFAKAECNLGNMYRLGLGTPQDYAKAFKYYNLAAKQELAEAQSWLGLLYENGFGVSPDVNIAVSWYKKAAKQGSEFAKDRIIILCKVFKISNCK